MKDWTDWRRRGALRPTTEPVHCPACGAAALLSPHWSRASFTAHVEGEFVVVVDLDLDMSVTNDAERVVAYLGLGRNLLAGRRLIYRDTDGCWDEIKLGRARCTGSRPFAGFRSLGVRGDCRAALAKAEGKRT